MAHDPAVLLARVRKAAKGTPYTVTGTADGFELVAEVLSPPGARGRRRPETLTHRVALDAAGGTYRVTDTRVPVPGAPEEAGDRRSLLTGFGRRPDAPEQPGTEGHRIVDEAAAGLGWTRVRSPLERPGVVLAALLGFCVLLLVVALVLLL
ncbi:hypothetical protein GCM10010472_11810 [Pseudonocardia halophobica]|uniref:Uncharacterized protein n=1 Tax=Pseudonocardia halophobica TaxID=29401 RepID=A0A9W6L1E4_9PSEU|nr:hypothetical protein [Pseudonocardia halophobica]GLL11851.1 hypothetical protein GCM10017577_29920 [Pseudonocardia halophobica]